jgi:hypothetical protein
MLLKSSHNLLKIKELAEAGAGAGASTVACDYDVTQARMSRRLLFSSFIINKGIK